MDPEQQKQQQHLLQQMMRQQHPYQQMVPGPGYGGPQMQMTAQGGPPHQPQFYAQNPGSQNQGVQQTASSSATQGAPGGKISQIDPQFQASLGGGYGAPHMNTAGLFAGQSQAPLYQHYQSMHSAQPGTASGQPGSLQHMQAALVGRPANSLLVGGPQNQGAGPNALLAHHQQQPMQQPSNPQQQMIMGGGGGLYMGPGAPTPQQTPHQTGAYGQMNPPGQLQHPQFQSQQQQQTLLSTGGPPPPPGQGLQNQNQIAQYLKQYHDQHNDIPKQQIQGAFQQTGSNVQQQAQQQQQQQHKVGAVGYYSLGGQQDVTSQVQPQQQQIAQPQHLIGGGAPPTSTNVHQLNLMGHLGQPGAQQQATLQATGGLGNPQMQQYMSQGGIGSGNSGAGVGGSLLGPGPASLAHQLGQQQAHQHRMQQQTNIPGTIIQGGPKTPVALIGQPGSGGSQPPGTVPGAPGSIGLQSLPQGTTTNQPQQQFAMNTTNTTTGAQSLPVQQPPGGQQPFQNLSQPGGGALGQPPSLQSQLFPSQQQLQQQQQNQGGAAALQRPTQVLNIPPQAQQVPTQQQQQQNQQPTHQLGTGIAGSVMAAESQVTGVQPSQPQAQANPGNQGQLQNPMAAASVGGGGIPPNPSSQTLPGPPVNNSQTMMNVSNLNKLAEYCATNGEYHHAIDYYLQLTSIDPDNGPAWTALGHCYLLVEDLQKSFNAYQHALYSLEDIKDPQLWYGIGILYEKFESYDHAISALVAVLKMSPNFYQKSEVLYKLGIIFAKTNQIEQAISYFQNSILTNTFTIKRKVDTLLKIGLLYEEAKDYQQAQRSYEAALNHDEGNYKIYQHIAWSYFLQGNINSALDYVRRAEKKNKGQSDSSYIFGRCFMALENNKEALENFQQAAYKSPGEAVYWATLAIFYYNTGNYTDAFENIIKGTTLNPQMGEVWYNLGVLYEKCRQPEEALIAYSKVLELDAEDSDAQKRITQIKSPYYQQEQQKIPQSTLQMKHPKFSLPNSLMILRKFKKLPVGKTPGADGGSQTLQQQLAMPPNPATQGGAGGGANFVSQTLTPGNNQPQGVVNMSNQGLGIPPASSSNIVNNQVSGGIPQDHAAPLQSANHVSPKLLQGVPPNSQQQFQGQQLKLQQDVGASTLPSQIIPSGPQGDKPPSQFSFGLLPGNSGQAPQNAGGLHQMKLQGGGAAGIQQQPNGITQPTGMVLANQQAVSNSPQGLVMGSSAPSGLDNLNRLNDFAAQPKQTTTSQLPTQQQQQQFGSNNFGQGGGGAANEPEGAPSNAPINYSNLQGLPSGNSQQTNQGIQQTMQPQQLPYGTHLGGHNTSGGGFNQNQQQVTQGQNIPGYPAQVGYSSQGSAITPGAPYVYQQMVQPNQHQQQTMQQPHIEQQNLPQAQSEGQYPGGAYQSHPPQQPTISLQKTNLNQIIQSLPQDVNLMNLTREQLIMMLQQQQQQQQQIQSAANKIEQIPAQTQQEDRKANEGNQEAQGGDPQQNSAAAVGAQGSSGMQFQQQQLHHQQVAHQSTSSESQPAQIFYVQKHPQSDEGQKEAGNEKQEEEPKQEQDEQQKKDATERDQKEEAPAANDQPE